jgi:type IV secretory pathway TrbD component
MTESEEDFLAPYPASGMRHKLAFGCDRVCASLLVTSAVLIGYLWMQWWGYLVAGLMIVGGIPVLRKMGRHDPLLVRVFLRSLRYRRFYGATRKEIGRAQGDGRQWLRAGAY